MPETLKKKSASTTGLSRRQFIKGSMLTAGAAALGTTGCASDIHTDAYPDIPENDVNLRSNGKSVLILGGGFGGMHAACELLDRGFNVTIIEKTDMLGGKLKSWRDKDFGVPPVNNPSWTGYPHDHGAHAVWGFYNNLREFMRRHKYRLWELPTSMYTFHDRDGSCGTVGTSSIIDDLKGINKILPTWEDIRSLTNMARLSAFDFNNLEQRKYLDSISLPEWARSIGISDEVVYRFLAPTSEMAMIDLVDKTSALYFLMVAELGSGSPDDMKIDLFQHPPGETYIGPIEHYIKSRGGEILYNTEVIKINGDGDNSIKSVSAGGEGPAKAGVRTWKCTVCGSVFSSPTKPDRCPVCGAPASKIQPVSSGPAKEFKADYYVVAMHTPGAKAVVSKSNLLGEPYFDNIMKLDGCGAYIVNNWYSNCQVWEKKFPGLMVFYPSNFKFLGITLNWAYNGMLDGKKLADPLVPDYANKNINVIETQIPDGERVQHYSNEMISKLVHEEFKIVMPDLPDPTDFYVNRWDTYSPQRVGYEANRPTIQSPIDNLFFIGDWVQIDHLSVYMEKTYVTAKMVTNHILNKIGQKEGKIKILKSGTPTPLRDTIGNLFDVRP